MSCSRQLKIRKRSILRVKYEQLRERNIGERKQMEDELFGEV